MKGKLIRLSCSIGSFVPLWVGFTRMRDGKIDNYSQFFWCNSDQRSMQLMQSYQFSV